MGDTSRRIQAHPGRGREDPCGGWFRRGRNAERSSPWRGTGCKRSEPQQKIINELPAFCGGVLCLPRTVHNTLQFAKQLVSPSQLSRKNNIRPGLGTLTRNKIVHYTLLRSVSFPDWTLNQLRLVRRRRPLTLSLTLFQPPTASEPLHSNPHSFPYST